MSFPGVRVQRWSVQLQQLFQLRWDIVQIFPGIGLRRLIYLGCLGVSVVKEAIFVKQPIRGSSILINLAVSILKVDSLRYSY